jgi:8-oxo-dGTP diphosphatase
MTINKLSNDTNLMRMPVAVDLVILTVKEDALCALVIRRGIKPYVGQWALPGGFVRQGESLEAAARRELEEETGVKSARIGHIEQLATFGAPKRDPRERVISVAYLAFVPDLPEPKAGGDARDARITPVRTLFGEGGKLAFDHNEILRTGVERARAKLEYTSLAATFCSERFTINELRKIYEAVWGVKLDPANFHRKVTKTPGFIVPTSDAAQGESGRPALIYMKGDALTLHPPLMRTRELGT